MQPEFNAQEPSTSLNTPPARGKRRQNSQVWTELILCVIVPTLVLKYLSPEDRLGPVYGLILGLSIPLLYGLQRFYQERKFGFIPALGFISILLTSGIGLLELDPKYVAIKEAAIPLIIAVGTVLSLRTRYPLIKTMIYNDTVLQIDKVDAALAAHQSQAAFERVLQNATYILASSFLLSAVLNYGLAKYIVTSPAGTPAFNDELGTMNLLSYPVITLPCVIVMGFAMYYLFREIKKLTGLTLEEIIHQ